MDETPKRGSDKPKQLNRMVRINCDRRAGCLSVSDFATKQEKVDQLQRLGQAVEGDTI